jgi:hypothetical protein
MRILERLERANFNVFDNRPQLGARDTLPLAWQTLTWNGS